MECPHCGEVMVKAKREPEGGCFRIAIILLIGLGLCVFLFPCGLIPGLPLVFFSPFAGGKAVPFWKCPDCHVLLPRG